MNFQRQKLNTVDIARLLTDYERWSAHWLLVPPLGMARTHPTQNSYDHRLKEAISVTGNPHLFADVDIKPSTRRTWARAEVRPVVTSNEVDVEVYELLDKVEKLNRKAEQQTACICLLSEILELRGFRLDGERVPLAEDKCALLRAIASATQVLALGTALELVGLSKPRYHAWKNRNKACGLEGLDDKSSCPRSSPNQLTREENRVMKELVESQDYRHIAIQNLALLAQRLGKVFASAGTWYKKINAGGWKRPRRRVHPTKPKTGLRATRINEYWQTDATVIRLTTGLRIYLQAIIDNFSRKILAWRVTEQLSSATTRDLLVEAMAHLPNDSAKPDVVIVTDGGPENLGKVDELLKSESRLSRLIAQADILFSNSLIEAFWLQLKHCWLFLHSLETTTAVIRLVQFYVDQHNTVVPRLILGGRTPDEMYSGAAADLPLQLAKQREEARRARVAANRALSCQRCEVEGGKQRGKEVQGRACRVSAAESS